ncbi:sialidase [Bacillus sp. sid0103]|uniref:F510_1955 family glycosylhydrolase n=1 Tax=Bacillus sp. sid0103 TaxID=2856337 RepID=UPI001C47536B|nr:sialidase [Bacillus sp. sid0103]MBV7505292.1 sialidase [Bacillus sp. sid0103]
MKNFKWIVSLTLTSVILAACTGKETQNTKTFEEVKDVKIEHTHGLGYAENKNELYFATHDGLVRYSDNKWYEITRNKHDYMGFQAVDTGFYSSGHPEPGSDLKNPLGLIKSTDEGKSFKKLTFYGETDFHYLAAGFNSHMIYAINETPNSKLDTGLYNSEDGGKTWEQSKMQGFSAESIGNIATHPTKKNMIGISTDKGLYFSDNNGDQFKIVSKAAPITTLEFEEDSMLYFTTDGDNPSLYKQDLTTQNATKLSIPDEINSKNPIMFIASNPKNRDEITVITYKKDIYQTKDKGGSWKELIKNGKIQ